MDIDFVDQPNGLTVQNQLTELFYEKLLPRMETLFDEFGNDKYLISFETLKLDIGDLPAKHWEEVLVEETLRALRKELLAADKIKISVALAAQKTEEAFLFFLQHGHLPWNSAVLSIKELEQLIPGKQFAKKLQQLIQRYPANIERLVNNFSDSFLLSIIKELADEAKVNTPAFEKAIKEHAPKIKKAQAAFIKMLCSETKIVDKAILPVVATGSPAGIKNEPSTDESIYVHNAGLVILHPFLPELFRTFDLLSKDSWKDKASQHQAIQILEYLVTGSDEGPEFSLPLNKIICGLEPAKVMEPVVPLPVEIKTECATMLQAVVQHWSALKNSSIEALRETYLQRLGKLTKRDQGWLLQVESKAVDVLLGRLPWGIGTVRLPWMNSLLFTEWY